LSLLSHGIWMSQVGAVERSIGASEASLRLRVASASRTGRYGSPAPLCSTHWPWAWTAEPSPATKLSIRVVLPMPASPDTQKTCLRPALAWFHAVCSRASASRRPIICGSGEGGTVEGIGAAAGVGAATPTAPMKR
jgi:hypothetical protein